MTDSTKPSSSKLPFIIGVSGGSGSGKTFFARALKERLNNYSGHQACEILFQDSYYIDQSSRFDFDGGSVNFDHPSSLDFELLAEHLRQLKSGHSIQVPKYDFVSHSRLASCETMSAGSIVLVDGILILHPTQLRELFDDMIFFDTPEMLRFERRLRRDVIERGRTEEGVRSQFVTQVKPMHDQYVEPTKRFAQYVVKELSDFDEALDLYFEKYKRVLGIRR